MLRLQYLISKSTSHSVLKQCMHVDVVVMLTRYGGVAWSDCDLLKIIVLGSWRSTCPFCDPCSRYGAAFCVCTCLWWVCERSYAETCMQSAFVNSCWYDMKITREIWPAQSISISTNICISAIYIDRPRYSVTYVPSNLLLYILLLDMVSITQLLKLLIMTQ